MDVIASYLSAEVLTWAVPLVLLIGITIWWIVVLRRRSSNDA
jgi:hypothetical protein